MKITTGIAALKRSLERRVGRWLAWLTEENERPERIGGPPSTEDYIMRLYAEKEGWQLRALGLERVAKAARALSECILPAEDGNAWVSRSYGGKLALDELRRALAALDIHSPAAGRPPNGCKLSDDLWRVCAWQTEPALPPEGVRSSAGLGDGGRLTGADEISVSILVDPTDNLSGSIVWCGKAINLNHSVSALPMEINSAFDLLYVVGLPHLRE